jgi:hypothetical protein
MFGADLNYIKIYDYLKRFFSLTDINKGDLKKVQHEGKTIVGYGLKRNLSQIFVILVKI